MANKDLGEGIENFEEEVENLKNTKMKLFGITMTPTTIGALFALLGTIGGGLYGGFEVYKDYMDMKEIIQNVDTDAIEARNNVIETKLDEAIDYTRDIKGDLKNDIIKLEAQIDRLEDKIDESEVRINSTKKEIDITLKEIRTEMNTLQKDVTSSIREVESIVRESEKGTRKEMRDLRTNLETDMDTLEKDMKETVQEALDNPLAD
jgi:peptidoglycan hydrolase CwlO-like protein